MGRYLLGHVQHLQDGAEQLNAGILLLAPLYQVLQDGHGHAQQQIPALCGAGGGVGPAVAPPLPTLRGTESAEGA